MLQSISYCKIGYNMCMDGGLFCVLSNLLVPVVAKMLCYFGLFPMLIIIVMLTHAAGKPKKENALKTICLMLGPDFISDHITVR